MKKKCILILGMHRSGTSVLSGLFNLSGINLGKDLMKGTNDNKKGYFENNKIVSFNVKLLNHLNTTWNDIRKLDETLLLKIKNDQNLIKEAKQIILDEFDNSANIGIKDPRICLLYIFWEQVLHELNFEINTVIIYRDPLEVAYSLNKRDNLDLNYSILLWFKHFIYAERMSRNSENRIIISYNSLIKSPIQEIKFIVDKFNIKNNCNEFALSDFIDEKLRNSKKNIIKEMPLPNYIHQFILLCLEMKNNQDLFTKIFLLDKIFIEYCLNNTFYLNNTLENVYGDKALKIYKKNRLYRQLKRFFYRIMIGFTSLKKEI